MIEKVVLYESTSYEKKVSVIARLENDSLSVIGSEFYVEGHPKAANNGLNEFYYQLDEENTDKLSKSLCEKDISLLDSLQKKFRSPNVCLEFQTYCENHDIHPFLHFG